MAVSVALAAGEDRFNGQPCGSSISSLLSGVAADVEEVDEEVDEVETEGGGYSSSSSSRSRVLCLYDFCIVMYVVIYF